MKGLGRRPLVAVAALGVALASCGTPGAPTVFVIVVDQLRTDYIERFQEHYQGGMRWLLDHGAYFPEAAYRHSSTSTAPGHATVATGMHPSSHGIVGNHWRERGQRIYSVADDDYESVGAPGTGVSPRALLAETLGDRLKQAWPGSAVHAFSTKDRSAALLGGSRADGAYWFSDACGCVVSSTYYGDALPDWLTQAGPEVAAAHYAGREWTRLIDDEALYERLSRRDRFPTERNDEGVEFPHRLPADGFESALRATPFADEITLAAAAALLRSGEIGADSSPDLILLGLSATDSIGHRFGPFSQEAMDNHLRLDRALGRFLEVVDETVGLADSVFALTADHGALPLVEHLVEQGREAKRFDVGSLWQEGRQAIDGCGAGPAEETVTQSDGTALYWNEPALTERGVERGSASACLADWLERQDGVEAVLTAERLAAEEADGVSALFRNAYYPDRSPHLQLHLRAGHYPGAATGTGHGTAHDYDRRVPVLFSGRGVAPGRYPREAGPEDIAPTLGRVLGLDLPLEPDTRVLEEALQ